MNVSARIVVLVLVASVAGSVAEARKPAPVPAAARAHFKQGRAYQEAGAWKDAIAEYEKAYALAPLPELLYNIGQCHRLGSDKPKAIAAYQRYLAAAPEGAFADEARSHIAALKLKIQVEEAEAAKLRAEAEAEAAKRRARELEEARGKAADEAYRRILRDQAEKERRAKEAAEAARLESTERAARLRVAEAAYQREVDVRRKVGRSLRVAGIVLQVVGPLLTIPAGFLVAAGFEQRGGLSDFDNRGTRWTAALDREYRRIQQLGWLATGTFVAAAAVLGTGIALYEVGKYRRRRAERAVPRPVVTPWVGPGGGGLALEGRF